VGEEVDYTFSFSQGIFIRMAAEIKQGTGFLQSIYLD
jgi:hypothetical protein